MRNFTAITMNKQFRGKGGPMKDRRSPKGGARNSQRELLLSDSDLDEEPTDEAEEAVCAEKEEEQR